MISLIANERVKPTDYRRRRLDEACLCRLKGNDAFHLVDKILDDD